MKIVAAILAGGQSRRMGRDKANLPSLENAETTMLNRTARLASGVFDSVFVVGRRQPDDWVPGEPNVTFLPDAAPDLGPSGGLATILTALSAEKTSVALLACDLPLLTPDALAWLRTMAEEGRGRHGMVVRNGEQIEPLFAVYTPDCLPLLADQLAKGKRSMQKLIEAGEFRVIDAPPAVAHTLVNVNTAEELAQARSFAESLRETGGASSEAHVRKP